MKWIRYVAATALLAVGCNVFGGDPYEEAIEYINELEASFAESAEFWQEFYDINEAHSAIFVPKCTDPRYGSILGQPSTVGFSSECGMAVRWNSRSRERTQIQIANLQPERLRELFDIWRDQMGKANATLTGSEFVKAAPTSLIRAVARTKPDGAPQNWTSELHQGQRMARTFSASRRNECLEGTYRAGLNEKAYAIEHGVSVPRRQSTKQPEAHIDCDGYDTSWARWLRRHL